MKTSLSQDFLHAVSAYIAEERLLPPAPSAVYVGLSGGADSVALLLALQALGYECHALHCNFHLRGAESDRDERFCRDLCARHGVQLTVQPFDTLGYMQTHGLSLEMAARALRYAWWHDVLEAHPLGSMTRLAIGHHAEDSAETLLMNLVRGTGVAGLTGIVPYNAATRVCRPLLTTSRAAIEAFVAAEDETFVTDSSNLEGDTLRNRLRLEVLPLLRTIAPQTDHGLALTARHLQGTAALAERTLTEVDTLTRQHEAWGVTWHEVNLPDVEQHYGRYASDFLHLWAARYVDTTRCHLVRASQWWYTEPRDLEERLARHRPTLSPTPAAVDPLYSALFDADALRLPLTVRLPRTADRLAPLGMHGHTRLLSDVFATAHLSPMQRKTTYLVEDAAGEILWVVGVRTSHHAALTPATRRPLRLYCLPSY